jgi:hypothetical protein
MWFAIVLSDHNNQVSPNKLVLDGSRKSLTISSARTSTKRRRTSLITSGRQHYRNGVMDESGSQGPRRVHQFVANGDHDDARLGVDGDPGVTCGRYCGQFAIEQTRTSWNYSCTDLPVTTRPNHTAACSDGLHDLNFT